MSALAVTAAAHLPWFGPFANDGPEPQYSAVSAYLVPPGSPAGMVPGTQSWGYLIVALSILLAVAAAALALVCAFSSRLRDLRGLAARWLWWERGRCS